MNINFNPRMINRHGIIAGATGSGKTSTIRAIAKAFNGNGISIIATDVKGDFNTSSQVLYNTNPMGLMKVPLSSIKKSLIARFLGLNEVQTQVLYLFDKIRSQKPTVRASNTIEELSDFLSYLIMYCDKYQDVGYITKQTIATIQRALYVAESKGLKDIIVQDNNDKGFNIPSLINGKLNVLDCTKIIQDKGIYSAYILNMLDNLYDNLKEVGDLDKPKLVVFIDEAHLIFKDLSKELLTHFEQIIKLIRSKGVGIYFCSQSPMDIPDGILAQLGNRIQHSLRAYTVKEQKALKAVAQGFRTNKDLDLYNELLNLGIGEAIISLLDDQGIPTIAQKIKVEL